MLHWLVTQVLNVKHRTGGNDNEGHATNNVSGDNVQRPNVPRTLRDDLLLKQCEDIKSKYLATFHAKLAAVKAGFESASKQVRLSSSLLAPFLKATFSLYIVCIFEHNIFITRTCLIPHLHSPG